MNYYFNEMTWQQYRGLPDVVNLPLNEQVRRYNIYINEILQSRLDYIHHEMAKITNLGGGSLIVQEEGLPSNAFEYVVDTTNSDNADFEVTVSADTNVTVTWGDGQTEEILVTSGASPFEFDHIYEEFGAGISYTIRVTFDNIENVTELEFYS